MEPCRQEESIRLLLSLVYVRVRDISHYLLQQILSGKFLRQLLTLGFCRLHQSLLRYASLKKTQEGY